VKIVKLSLRNSEKRAKTVWVVWKKNEHEMDDERGQSWDERMRDTRRTT